MIATSSAIELLQWLPALSGSRVGLHLFNADAEVVDRHGVEEEIDARIEDGCLVIQTAPGRSFMQRSHASGHLVATWPEGESDLEAFLSGLFGVLSEKQQLESDMESMYGSSLALLEEVSMVGDMLPKLSTGESEDEIAEMGMKALLVAASAERAIYVRVDPKEHAYAEIVVEVCMDAASRQAEAVPYAGKAMLLRTEGESLLWRAVDGHGGAILETVQPAVSLGPDTHPENLARRQIIAVPVRYGSGEKAVTLGVILLMDKRANVYSSSEEMGSQETKLSASVAAMLGSVLGTRKVVELRNEMAMGQALQRQILPSFSPSVPGFDLAGVCHTHGAIGGDYYDYLSLSDGRTMALIADVSGHNLPSGMVMVSARTCWQILSQLHSSSGVIFDELARSMFPDLSKTERFITAAAVTLEPGSNTIELVNAGHNPTMILRAATGDIEEIGAEDTVLGFLPSPQHDVHDTTLDPGDVLLIYTDGITEAMDASEEMFGEDRLRDVFRDAASRCETAEQMLASVLVAVDEWCDRNGGDDVSAVVIRAVEGG